MMKISRLALAVALAPGLTLADDLPLDQALKLSDTVVTANREAPAARREQRGGQRVHPRRHRAPAPRQRG